MKTITLNPRVFKTNSNRVQIKINRKIRKNWDWIILRTMNISMIFLKRKMTILSNKMLQKENRKDRWQVLKTGARKWSLKNKARARGIGHITIIKNQKVITITKTILIQYRTIPSLPLFTFHQVQKKPKKTL